MLQNSQLVIHARLYAQLLELSTASRCKLLIPSSSFSPRNRISRVSSISVEFSSQTLKFSLEPPVFIQKKILLLGLTDKYYERVNEKFVLVTLARARFCEFEDFEKNSHNFFFENLGFILYNFILGYVKHFSLFLDLKYR